MNNRNNSEDPFDPSNPNIVLYDSLLNEKETIKQKLITQYGDIDNALKEINRTNLELISTGLDTIYNRSMELSKKMLAHGDNSFIKNHKYSYISIVELTIKSSGLNNNPQQDITIFGAVIDTNATDNKKLIYKYYILDKAFKNISFKNTQNVKAGCLSVIYIVIVSLGGLVYGLLL